MDATNNVRYTILPKQCLDNWMESVGVGKLNDEICTNLAEDATYRVREVIHNALLFMRHAKRKCLTAEDFNNALKDSNTEPIYGHSGADVSTYKSVNFKDTRLSFIEEKEVNLRELAFEPVQSPDVSEFKVKASWLVLEGKPCQSGNFEKESNIETEEPLTSYVKNITAAVNGKNERLRKVALSDLRTNKKLQAVIPHLVSFLSNQVKLNMDNHVFSGVCYRLLLTLDALVSNVNILLSPYSVQLVKVALYIAVEAKLPVDEWKIIDTAALSLCKICRKLCSCQPNILSKLLTSFRENLMDASRPLSYLYGVIVSVHKLGIEAVRETLLPALKSVLNMLSSHLQNDTNKEVLHVNKALCATMAFFFSADQCFENNLVLKTKRQLSTVYDDLSETFGDVFTLGCTLTNHVAVKSNGVCLNVNELELASKHSTFVQVDVHPKRHLLGITRKVSISTMSSDGKVVFRLNDLTKLDRRITPECFLHCEDYSEATDAPPRKKKPFPNKCAILKGPHNSMKHLTSSHSRSIQNVYFPIL